MAAYLHDRWILFVSHTHNQRGLFAWLWGLLEVFLTIGFKLVASFQLTVFKLVDPHTYFLNSKDLFVDIVQQKLKQVNHCKTYKYVMSNILRCTINNKKRLKIIQSTLTFDATEGSYESLSTAAIWVSYASGVSTHWWSLTASLILDIFKLWPMLWSQVPQDEI